MLGYFEQCDVGTYLLFVSSLCQIWTEYYIMTRRVRGETEQSCGKAAKSTDYRMLSRKSSASVYSSSSDRVHVESIKKVKLSSSPIRLTRLESRSQALNKEWTERSIWYKLVKTKIWQRTNRFQSRFDAEDKKECHNYDSLPERHTMITNWNESLWTVFCHVICVHLIHQHC